MLCARCVIIFCALTHSDKASDVLSLCKRLANSSLHQLALDWALMVSRLNNLVGYYYLLNNCAAMVCDHTIYSLVATEHISPSIPL